MSPEIGNNRPSETTMAADRTPKENKPNMGQLMAVMGTAVLLARGSDLHARYRVAQLVDRLWPSLLRGQYALYTEKDSGKPVGFCNWAWISDAVLAEYKNNRPVKPEDWDSGEVLFFQEIIATEGHLRHMTRDIRNNIMGHLDEAYALRGFVRGEGEEDRKQRVMRFTGLGQTDTKPDSIQNIRPL